MIESYIKRDDVIRCEHDYLTLIDSLSSHRSLSRIVLKSSHIRLEMVRFRTELIDLIPSFDWKSNRTETQGTEPLKFRFGSVSIGSEPIETGAKRVQRALDLIFEMRS